MQIIPRAEHPISRRDIEKEALWVLQRLRSLGYKAYLVGGAVRDLYLGRAPKDYDVGTDARPSRLKKIFRNCRIIGRRFRIAHVFFPGDKIIEVATFRRSSPKTVRGENGIILRDNEYGPPEEDARRRDLTINGLFYDSATFSIIDCVGGVKDLNDRIVRTINPPDESFREDPVRMIRALRHASRTGFTVEKETFESIVRNSQLIAQANPSRLLEEFLKDLRAGTSADFFRRLLDTGLLEPLLPELAVQLRDHGAEHVLWSRLEALDRHIAAGHAFSNAALLAVLLHTVLLSDPDGWSAPRSQPPNVWRVISDGFHSMPRTLRISRRDAERVAQILIAYRKLCQCLERRKLTPTFREKTYTPEALDFLLIDVEARAGEEAGEEIEQVLRWKEDVARRLSHRRQAREAEEKEGRGDGEEPGGDEEDPRPRRRRRRRRRRKRHGR